MIESRSTNTFRPAVEPGRSLNWRETPGKSPRTYGVLIVEDEPLVRRVLDEGMRQEGFSVWLAASGKEALELYRRNGQDIDVVLLDVRMPGLDGPQTLAALKEVSPQIRACFMSGDLGQYTLGELHTMNAAAFFPKPFRLPDVARALRELACNGTLSASSL
ncbi:MAG: response regulator [Gemmataceae bacterium]